MVSGLRAGAAARAVCRCARGDLQKTGAWAPPRRVVARSSRQAPPSTGRINRKRMAPIGRSLRRLSPRTTVDQPGAFFCSKHRPPINKRRLIMTVIAAKHRHAAPPRNALVSSGSKGGGSNGFAPTYHEHDAAAAAEQRLSTAVSQRIKGRKKNGRLRRTERRLS
uniref:Uncharacterized protein n=1 Tax=Plectus sambesii TaxID=2011161 RepID=A0A914W5L9_9BILA